MNKEPGIWIPVIEVKLGSVIYLSRSLWWQNTSGLFFREDWSEEIGNFIELSGAFESQNIRKAAQELLNELRPDYQSVFGSALTFVYCKHAWKTLVAYSRRTNEKTFDFSTPKLSTVYLYNPGKDKFDPLLQTKPM